MSSLPDGYAAKLDAPAYAIRRRRGRMIVNSTAWLLASVVGLAGALLDLRFLVLLVPVITLQWVFLGAIDRDWQ